MERKGRYSIGDVTIDLDRQTVERDGTVLDISGLSFRLLACLVTKGSGTVSFDDLMDNVWAGVTVNEETITQRIRLLRKALGDDSQNPRYIRSVRGRGYQLIIAPKREPISRKISTSALIGVGIALAISVTMAIIFNRSEPEATNPLLERAQFYAAIGQPDDNERAIELFRKLLEQEPESTPAQLGLSFAYSHRVCKYNQPLTWAFEAENIARDLVAKLPEEADAHAALAYAYDCRGMIGKAIEGYEAAYALDPGNAASLASAAHLYQTRGDLALAFEKNLEAKKQDANIRYVDVQMARTLELLGYSNEAEQFYAEVFQLYPDNIFGNITYPQFLFAEGRFVEAEDALQMAATRNIERNALLILDGELKLLKGEPDQALAAFRAAVKINPNQNFPETLAILYGDAAAKSDWAKMRTEQIREDIATGDHWPNNRIELALIAPDAETAFLELNRAVDAGFLDKNYLLTSPLFARLRDLPGFSQIIEKINRRIISERKKLPDIRAALSEYNHHK